MSAADSTIDAAAWAEARERVQGYLRANGIVSPRLEELTDQVVAFARARAADASDRAPVEIATDAAMLLLEGWIGHIVGDELNESPGRRFAHERAAVHLAEVPHRWPEHFLRPEPPPPELEQHLRTTYVNAGPDLAFSNMAARDIDLGPVSDVADTTWRTFDKWPLLRGLATWALYLGLLVLAFYAVRL